MGWIMSVSGLMWLLTGPVSPVATGVQSQAVRTAVERPQGGVQLNIEPRRAQVFVDAAYAGSVDDFNGYYHHLTLPAGPHRIEILTSGYMPLIFDVDVVPGRTIVYRQTLQEIARDW